jgi:hypothetical protein
MGRHAAMPILLQLYLLTCQQVVTSGAAALSITSPAGYECFNASDIFNGCDLGRVSAKLNLSGLAAACDAKHDAGCRGFNSNGWLKRCVRKSCGAYIRAQHTTACIRSDTPAQQPVPQGCDPKPPPPSPSPPSPPSPSHPPFNCSVTAARSDCNCSGIHPPFAAPRTVPLLEDYHYPLAEPTERAALDARLPSLVAVSLEAQTATLRRPNGSTFSLTLGGGRSGLSGGGGALLVALRSLTEITLQYTFDEWGALVFLRRRSSSPWDHTDAAPPPAPRVVRKPIGALSKIKQPRYNFTEGVDRDWKCKQDIDPTDFLATVATAISVSNSDISDVNTVTEVTIRSAISVLAPNPDAALFGNPEESNKWSLNQDGELLSWPWPLSGRSGELVVWSGLSELLPVGCAPPKNEWWEEVKMGMAGSYLRIANLGAWSASGAGGCGFEILAVAAPGHTIQNFTSVALLSITSLDTRKTSTSSDEDELSLVLRENVTYLRVTVKQNESTLIATERVANGNELYAAIAMQDARWRESFTMQGAVAELPRRDQRYADTALALLTMYLNLDRGTQQQYGGGKFWNVYNTFLPLDTLALGGALNAWGHAATTQAYLGAFLHSKVNATTGKIIYSIFGCDSDTDYGRLISLFVRTVEIGGDLEWAKVFVPLIHAMAKTFLLKRADAVANVTKGSPLHGIVAGSPEHDICSGKYFYFSVNVWHVRGLQNLGNLHQRFPSLSMERAWEDLLLPTAKAWRNDINFAANFTAVRRDDGKGLFFLSPVVGSSYSPSRPPSKGVTLKEGGSESTCIERGTCFSSMTAAETNGGSNQETNYANFRIMGETLLAGVLDAKYERAIMSFRQTHRGELLGMTRFRDGLDDMPILGYGRGDLRHDRVASFHVRLAGHTLNYLARGTMWGTEQRQQIDWAPRYAKMFFFLLIHHTQGTDS